MMATDIRAALIEFIRHDLVGPAHGDNEVLDDPPKLRYVAGVLFPRDSERNESAAAKGVEEEELTPQGSPEDEDPQPVEGASGTTDSTRNETTESDYDDVVTLANSYRPSAVSLTFMVTGNHALVIAARAAVYSGITVKSADGKRQFTNWVRHPLLIQEVKATLAPGQPDYRLIEGLDLRVVCRPKGPDLTLVTVSLFNTTYNHQRGAQTFFQSGFSVRMEEGSSSFVEYRSRASEIAADDESLGLALLYRNRRIFAVGHGCAADWADTTSDKTTQVRTEEIPAVLVPPIIPLACRERCFSMSALSDETRDRDELFNDLFSFCQTYEAWLTDRIAESEQLRSQFQRSAEQNLALCRVALERMRAGVVTLRANASALQAFRLVNRAMLTQQINSRRRRKLTDKWDPFDVRTYTSDTNTGVGYWRAFQLAFILITIPGIVDAKSQVQLPDGTMVSSHELVDLIWFPTGGGKTEAYLALTAFVIFIGRLQENDPGGCKVLMRYTLRLLTSQQFQRAASLICACEQIRRENEDPLGTSPITIGLWVGQSLTPNDEKDALNKLGLLSRNKDGAKNPFQLLSCPWCGTELNNPTRLGYAEFKGRQVFVCPCPDCKFGQLGKHLPVCIVDETLYSNPATLIIATVDKFAMLAWRERASALLTLGGGPDLIIQDELHLISGPLGSMVGLYETVIDYLCKISGKSPKIVASTATIRRADQQCLALYNRRMLQFPPSGLDASDSFFAREDRSSPGRIYIGVLPSAASSPLTAQIRSVVALMQGLPLVSGADGPETAMDPFWTLVQYFGSLKELGRAATFITADIPEFLPTAHRRYGAEGSLRRFLKTSEELTSRKTEDEIPKILKRLETRFSRAAEWDTQALDTVLATNMISVGVDVERLGLMMIVTQPKSTSEYIQASSRVGRSNSSPGLVLTLYNGGRPRDRSHYEHFRAYHEAFYRFVEPTSVTPFSPPALERSLHGVLAIAGRHVAGWKSPRDFDARNGSFVRFLSYLRDRVRAIDPDHELELESILQDRLDEWSARRPERWGDLGRNTNERVLLWPAGLPIPPDFSESWPTPTSLRNVDVECSVAVIPHYSGRDPQ